MFIIYAVLYIIAACIVFEVLSKIATKFNALTPKMELFLLLISLFWGTWGEFALPLILFYAAWKFCTWSTDEQQATERARAAQRAV